MTLTVTAGSATADSYISAADASTYHDNRGNSDFVDADTADQEAALRKATQWLDGRYRTRFPGQKATKDQSLAWPRSYASDNEGYALDGDEIPQAIKDACCELALLVVQGSELGASADRGGMVKEETVGPITTVYQDGAPATATYPFIDAILSNLIGSPGMGRIVRA